MFKTRAQSLIKLSNVRHIKKANFFRRQQTLFERLKAKTNTAKEQDNC